MADFNDIFDAGDVDGGVAGGNQAATVTLVNAGAGSATARNVGVLVVDRVSQRD